MDLTKINGNEIIDYLNSLNDEFDDCCLSSKTFEFEHQEIVNNRYILYFTVSWDNWGEDFEVNSNRIYIDKEGITVGLNDPICDDSYSIIAEELEKWIYNHKFKSEEDINHEYNLLLKKAKELLESAEFGPPDNHPIYLAIEMLNKAKKYLK